MASTPSLTGRVQAWSGDGRRADGKAHQEERVGEGEEEFRTTPPGEDQSSVQGYSTAVVEKRGADFR